MTKPASHSGAPACDVDFYCTETIRQPVPAYREMLDTGPVIWLEKHDLFAICGFAELTGSIRNHAVFCSGKGVSIDEDVNKLLIGSTLNSDPPQHDATRAITFSPLTPKALAEVRERIAAEAEFIADQVIAKGDFDAASELAPHIPLTIVRDLVGLGEHGRTHMLDWGAATFELMGDPHDRRDKALTNMKALRRFLESPDTLDSLSADGWARRATRRGIEDGIAPDRAAELMRDYIAPSLDTTISAIGYGIKLFAENPDQWDLIREDASRIRNAIEEVVRLNTPIRAFSRYVESDIEVAGVHMPQGNRVLMVFGSANRDPAKFPDPNRFDITRDVRGHVGFGHGVHACLGMHLARLEMTCLFEAFAARVKHFEITGPVKASMNSTIHSFANIPVKAVVERHKSPALGLTIG